MPFVSILAAPGDDYLRAVATSEPMKVAQPLTAEGRFGERPLIVVFQREVPDPSLLLERLGTTLASSRVADEVNAYLCPAPFAIRALEHAVAELWPPNRLRCADCRHYFVVPIAEHRRMYVACPHCHNPMLNPRWDST